MEDYPKTMLEFNKRFNTEHSCQEYLYKMRWPEGFICPHCQHREYWMMKRGQSQQYRCRRCRSWISATAGTIFQDTHTYRCRYGLELCGKWLAKNMALVRWGCNKLSDLANTEQHGLCFISCG